MLTGIRVLDLTRVLAGPLCTMMLGDLGADVIKVERPGEGDETRGWGPPFHENGQSAYFLSVNRNKLGIAADLHDGEDRRRILDLIADCDVVVDNFRPGSLARLGIDARELVARHPRLVWCTITGFGEESERPGYDYVAQAESGWMAITGPVDGDPHKVGVALADVIAGKDAAVAILAALVGRDRPGAERRVVISLAASAGAALVNVAQNALVSGTEARRWGNAHPNLVPYQLFHAADAPLILAVGSDGQWVAAMRALGLDELADDAAVATNAGRLAARERIVGRIAERVAEGRAARWCAALDAAGVPCGRVKGVLDVVRDAGGSALTGMPSAVGGAVRFPPPALDEHGDLIRRDGWRVFAMETGRNAR